VPSNYQPRRPRASPLWQLVRHGWDEFLANYEGKYRQSLGPLHPAATATVESFFRCGDLASGFIRREEIEFFLRLHGLWEGLIQLPRPPPPPFDIETMEPIEPPWQAIKEWIPDDEPDLDWFNRPRNPSNPDPDGYDQSQTWQAPEIHLDDERILVLEPT